jgi:hypothetical protein
MWLFTYGATCSLRRFVRVGILHVCAEALKSGYFRDTNEDTYSRLARTSAHVHTRARTRAHTYARTHTHTHAHIHARAHAHAHTRARPHASARARTYAKL